MKEPEEPDAWESKLPAEEPDFTEDPALSESDTKKSEEVPLEPDEESHGVTVVVTVTSVAAALNLGGAGAGFAGGGVGFSGTSKTLDSVSAEPSCKHVARMMAQAVFMITTSTLSTSPRSNCNNPGGHAQA